MYPCLSKSTVDRTHTGQSLIHSDAEIKPVYGNILGIRKPSFKAVLKSFKKILKIPL